MCECPFAAFSVQCNVLKCDNRDMGPHGSWYGKYFMLEKKGTFSKVEMLINAYFETRKM